MTQLTDLWQIHLMNPPPLLLLALDLPHLDSHLETPILVPSVLMSGRLVLLAGILTLFARIVAHLIARVVDRLIARVFAHLFVMVVAKMVARVVAIFVVRAIFEVSETDVYCQKLGPKRKYF